MPEEEGPSLLQTPTAGSRNRQVLALECARVRKSASMSIHDKLVFYFRPLSVSLPFAPSSIPTR
eukprot:3823527-Amphidinium_carterae.1